MADIEAYAGQVMDDPKQVPNRKDQSKAKKSSMEPVKEKSLLTMDSLMKKHPNPKEHFAAKYKGPVDLVIWNPLSKRLRKKQIPRLSLNVNAVLKIEFIWKTSSLMTMEPTCFVQVVSRMDVKVQLVQTRLKCTANFEKRLDPRHL